MKILLSDTQKTSAILISQTEDDRRTLSILFNSGLIRGGHTVWIKKESSPELPEGYEKLKQYDPTGFLIIHFSEEISDSTKEGKASKLKEQMEAETKKETEKEERGLFDYLEEK